MVSPREVERRAQRMMLAGLCCLELAGGKNRKIVLPSPYACRTSHPTNGDGEGEGFLQGHASQRCVLRS